MELNENFSNLDLILFTAYCLGIIALGLFVSRTKKGEEKTSEEYFLAGKSLPWWAVGASLIASNISAEQFIGMSGSGAAMGLAISTYEWMAAATLLVVAKFFLPIFIKKEIYTMPQFLEKRYDNRVRTSLAIFWLLLYVFVNLTTVLYMGALAIESVMGVPLTYGIIGLVAFSLIYSLAGGLTAVAWTDVVQVIFLVLGGLLTTFLALDAVSNGEGFMAGLSAIYDAAPGHFNMILEPNNDFYNDLPGISVLIGGMWIINLNYWGCNQYITQRALASKSLAEAQRGIAFAGFLKILMPFIVVIPGIAAYVLLGQEGFPTVDGTTKWDYAYPYLLDTFVGSGFKGIAFAALVAAIVSSVSSMSNSTATIFTMDIYSNYINKKASEKQKVFTGRAVAFIALVIATVLAPQLDSLGQVFQFIQEYTGMVSPGILTIFVFGFFWKKATPNAALVVAVLTVPLGGLFKYLSVEYGFVEPFIDRMGLVFLILAAIMVVVSLIDNKGEKDPRAIDFNPGMFATDMRFNLSAIIITGILAALYGFFW